MSSKDMFRKEQRFSFRKFSFGLASAVIANVIFGGAIASSPVVHANTATETAAVATSERTASLTYTVNIVDQAGKVVDTQTKTVSVKTTEATASTTAYLTTDLVPTGYALVSGLGQVTVTENATNVFTVQVEEIASEAVSTAASESATSTTAVSESATSTAVASETATSESATATSEVAASETATSESATATSEVAASETATTASETSATKAERTAYLSYVTQYINEEKEIVDSKGHLVAVTTTDETAKTQVTVSASENMPAGYELAQEKAEVVLQLVENQANVLAFAVAKKSEEEEIAESQLSNRDVLTQVTSEADLLADEALRQVAGEQAGNTALETAANDTKAAAAAANQVLANAAATEAELGAQIDTVRTSTQNLAAEMLKVDADGVLTAQLNTGVLPEFYNQQKVDKGQAATQLNDLMVWNGVEMTKPYQLPIRDNGATIDEVYYIRKQGSANQDSANQDKTAKAQIDNLSVSNTGLVSGSATNAETPRTVYAVIKSGDNYVISEEAWIIAMDATGGTIEKNAGQTVTTDEILNAVTVNWGGYDPSWEFGEALLKKEVITTDLPTSGQNNVVKVKLTNAQGQEKIVDVIVNWPVTNHAPVITTSATDTNVTVQEGTPKAIHIFSKTVGDTEDANGNKLFTPVASKDLENPLVPIKKLAEFSDPDAGDTVTYKYNDLRNDQPHLSQTNLVMTNDGYLSGNYTDWGPGAKSTRRIDVTDNHGATTSSEPFLVLGYTIKADSSELEVVGSPTLDQIKSKLVLDVNSAYPNAVPSEMVVPTDQYGHQIVGYRTAEGQETTEVTSADQLPDGGTYQVKVRTTNIYGQEIFNWVNVNSTPENTPTTGTNKKPLYVFNNTPIATVGDGTNVADNVNKVNVVTLEDPDGINSVEVTRETDVNTGIFTPGDIGITIDKDGNASGTPKVGPIGVYSRGLTVTDGKGATTNLFPRNDEMETYVLDATAGATITKAVGETVTEDEILDNVTVNTGNSNTMDAAIDSRYRKVLAPDQTVPTAPGEYDVKVRVITESNVYKDVTVKVIIPKYSDTLTATATENTSLVPGSGTAVTQPIVIKDANNNQTTAPAGTTYEIDPAFKAEKEALGYEISVSPTGEVSVKAPAGQEADITVPVTVTYPDKTTDSVSVPFKVDQKGLAQLKAKEAIDEKLADETKDLEDKKNAEIAAITNNPDLTQEQKDAAIQDITDAAEIAKKALNDAAGVAKDNVAAATTPEEAKAAQTAGENTLADLENGAEAALDLITAKAEATDAINDKLADELKDLAAKQAEAEKAIDASTMTPEEKAAAKEALQDVVDAEKAKLEDAAKKATDEIAAAKTPADVKAAEIAGETALTDAGTNAEAAVELAKDKELAKEAIRTEEEEATKAAEKLAEDAIKAINDNPNLSDAEKQAAIDEVNKAVDDALEAIAENAKTATEAAENAQALADLEAAKKAQEDADKAAIDKATPLVEDAVLEAAKQDALNKLDEDAAQAAKDIAANPNLTDKQVEKALADLEKDLAKAKDAVNAATTPEAVQTAEDKGVDTIAGDVLDAAQLDALNKLEEDTKETVAAIESNPNLTPDEKAAAIAKVEEKADDAKSDILTAETPEAVQAVEENADKDLAKEELKAAADDAKKAIEANDNLTPEEKQAAIDAVDAEVAKANEAIDAAKTPEEVNAATLAGEKAVA
ncbi:TPA: DUF1542 domain-containing protein, partial [Streptococcus suis]|nr:DUF1542 domain-containing protein [Streptococcus suis]